MDIEPLSLLHQSLLKKKFADLNLFLSEYTFANLYLFRHVHNYQVLTLDNETFIQGMTRDKISFIMFTSPPVNYSHSLLKTLSTYGEFFFPLPDIWLKFLEKYLMQASFKKDDCDYLFKKEKLDLFPGRHLDSKRNLVKQFLREYTVRNENLVDQMNDCHIILDHWATHYKDDLLQTDYFACQEAIHLFQHLNLHGRITYVDGNPAGFTLGERITKECYTLHFCKGIKLYKGLYQYLYQDLAQSMDKACLWINLEQDLGIAMIRKAKHSYSPDQLLNKWRVKLQFS